MEVLQKHRVPYKGFAWDHPLRQWWRENHEDPAIESFWLFYCWRRPETYLMLGLGIACLVTGVGCLVRMRTQPAETLPMLGVVTIVMLMSAYMCMRLPLRHPRHTRPAFRRSFEEEASGLAKELSISLEDLGSWSWSSLQDAADNKLVSWAMVTLEAEKDHPDDPLTKKRIETRENFRRCMNHLEKYKLPRHINDHGWYFREARKRMPK
jgi:hypothetical protein